MVHQVKLRENSDGTFTLRINMTGQFQSFGVDDIDIRGRNGEDDAVRFRNVFGNQVSRLFFDVARLISDGHLVGM